MEMIQKWEWFICQIMMDLNLSCLYWIMLEIRKDFVILKKSKVWKALLLQIIMSITKQKGLFKKINKNKALPNSQGKFKKKHKNKFGLEN
jgi:hypothetical protein